METNTFRWQEVRFNLATKRRQNSSSSKISLQLTVFISMTFGNEYIILIFFSLYQIFLQFFYYETKEFFNIYGH